MRRASDIEKQEKKGNKVVCFFSDVRNYFQTNSVIVKK